MDDSTTFEGIPIKTYLSRNVIEKEINPEVKEVVRDELKGISQSVNRHFRPKYAPTQEKNSEVHVFTDDEIRKEYGLDAKTPLSRTESILFVLQNHGPSTSVDISSEVKHVKYNSLTAAISMLYQRSKIEGSSILTRRKGEKGYVYTLKEGMDYKAASEALNAPEISSVYNKRYKPSTSKKAMQENRQLIEQTEYRSMEEKAIHIMKLFGPISAKEIGRYLENSQYSTVSAIVSTIYRKSLMQSQGLIIRKKRPTVGYVYSIQPEYDYTEVFSLINPFNPKEKPEKQPTAPKPVHPLLDDPETPPVVEEKPEHNIDPLTILPDMVTKAVEKAVAKAAKTPIVEQEQESDATINSKLTIDVNVQVNFNWGFK